MSTTLYRKYRPQTFAELIGQDHIKVTLQNEISSGKIAHAYLFSGSRGIGKTTTARLLAKALNCEKRKKKESEPCNTCSSCQEISQDRSLDVIEIDAASHTGVDNMRENIIEGVRFHPHRSKYKIFIIDEVHMLSLSAFNALLKTLEEPPPYTIFILCTTEIHRVPETIISRCQRFDFKRVGAQEIVSRLKNIIKKEKIKVQDTVLKTIALRSGGFVRDAESLLGQILALGGKEISEEQAELVIPPSNLDLVVEFINFLIKNDVKSAIEHLDKLVQGGVDLEQFNQDLIEYLRKTLLMKVGGTYQEFDFVGIEIKQKKEFIKQLQEVPLERVASMIKLFLEKAKEIRGAQVLLQLPLEIAVVELCSTIKSQIAPTYPSLKKYDQRDRNLELQNEDREKTQKISKIHPQNSNEFLGTPPYKKAGRVKSQESSPTSSLDSPASNIGSSIDTKVKEASISLDDVKKRWREIIVLSQRYNHSLPFILKIAYPLELKEQTLKIGFEYDFHLDRLKERKNKNTVEKVLKDIFLIDLKVEVRKLTKEEKEKLEKERMRERGQGESRKLIQSVLKVFGGRVVE